MVNAPLAHNENEYGMIAVGYAICHPTDLLFQIYTLNGLIFFSLSLSLFNLYHFLRDQCAFHSAISMCVLVCLNVGDLRQNVAFNLLLNGWKILIIDQGHRNKLHMCVNC